MSQSLSLNEDVYFCVTQGQGVFLDLTRDEYSAIPLPAAARGDGVHAPEEVMQAFDLHRRELMQERLLTEGGEHPARVLAYRSIPQPTGHVFHPDDQRAFGLAGEPGRAVHVRARDLFDFVCASRQASIMLQSLHMRDVVARVRTRKASAAVSLPDLDLIRRETAIFRRLRPWYPRGYLCLFDALALLEFLAGRRLFPLWVFGVQAQPFGAHCWVQADGLLLNEVREYAEQFTPIMSV